MAICRKTGKEIYTRQGAEAAVNSMRERQPKHPVYKYPCSYCASWHVATVVQTVAQKKWHMRHTS
jgi:hypothetical protein